MHSSNIYDYFLSSAELLGHCYIRRSQIYGIPRTPLNHVHMKANSVEFSQLGTSPLQLDFMCYVKLQANTPLQLLASIQLMSKIRRTESQFAEMKF